MDIGNSRGVSISQGDIFRKVWRDKEGTAIVLDDHIIFVGTI